MDADPDVDVEIDTIEKNEKLNERPAVKGLLADFNSMTL